LPKFIRDHLLYAAPHGDVSFTNKVLANVERARGLKASLRLRNWG